MKVITEPKESIAKLWGHPKGTAGTTYRLMNYTLQSECDDGTLLYSVVTSEMVLISDDDFDIRTLPATYSPAMDELIGKHFLVPMDFDEKKSVDQLRLILRKINKKNEVTGYTILPTTSCNARCFYCYESGFPKQTMSEDTAKEVLNYIASHCIKKQLDITWFGGEPLVGEKIIDFISHQLIENGFKFSSKMVSNAYLFDKSIIEKASSLWNLKSVQITLDGTEDEYNKAKNYQGVTGSPYQRVLGNINLLLDAGIQVVVRLNLAEYNIGNLSQLVDELQKHFGERKGFQAYVHLIYNGVGYNPLTSTTKSEDQLYQEAISIEDKLIACGLSFGLQKLPELRSIHCMADNEGCVIIFPDGKLTKCENSSPGDAFGDIFGNKYESKVNIHREYSAPTGCDLCPLYPYCLHLKVCPEEGKCTSFRRKTKIEAYTDMIKKIYHKSHESLINGQKDSIDLLGYIQTC